MGARTIETKLVLSGEKEYLDGLKGAYEGIADLGRQIQKTDGIIAASGGGFEKYGSKVKLLNNQIEKQRELIQSLARRMNDVKGMYGDSTYAESMYAKKIAKETRNLEQMERQLRETEAAMDRLSRAGDKLKQGWTILKDITANILQDALYAGFEQVKDFVAEGVNTASDLEEITNVVDTAFGRNAYKIKDFADTAIYQFGLSSKAAQEYAGKLGAAFNALGLKDQALEMSKTLTGLTGDLASFWNMSADDAYGKIFAGIVSGETEGLKSLGIVMTEAELNSFAMAEGIKQGTKNMSAAEKTMLRYRYVLKATSQAQGDFAKTSDSYANQLRVAELSTQNLGGKMGQTMLPAITNILDKYNEFANSEVATDLFEDIGESVGNLAEGAFNGLIEAMEFVKENGEEIKSLFSTLGGGAVGYGLAKAALTLKDVAVQMRSIAGFKSLLGGNWLTAGLMVGGVALAGLHEYMKSMDHLQNALNDLDMSLDPESQQKITDGINAGIEAANKEYDIKLGIQADIESLQSQLDGIFSSDSPGGAKITRTEWKEASAYVNEVVKPDIEEAKRLLDEYKQNYKESLLELTGEDGEKLYTEEEATAATNAVTEKTQSLITELETAYADYNALLKTIYRGGGSATEAEIAELDKLLSRIGEIQTQLAMAQDEAMLLQKSYYTRTTAGYGDVEDASFSLGYIQQKTSNELSEIKTQTEQKITQIQQLADKGLLSVEESIAAMDAAEAEMAEANAEILQEQQTMLQAVFDGMSKAFPESAAAVEQLAGIYEAYAAIYSEDTETEGGVAERILADADVIKEASEETAKTLEELQEAVDSGDYEKINELALQVFENLETAATEALAGMENNPIAAVFQEAMDGFDTAQLDMTALDGMLADMFKAEDFTQKGTEIGEYLFAGIGTEAEAQSIQLSGTLEEMAKSTTQLLNQLEQQSKTGGSGIAKGIAEGIGSGEDAIGMEITGIQGFITGAFSGYSVTIPVHFEVDQLPDIPGSTGGAEEAATAARNVTTGAVGMLAGGRSGTTTTTRTASLNVTQNIYAKETSYVGQQAEATRQLRNLARSLA